MTTRIPKQNIVSGGKRVLPAGHPDLVWYDPNEVIIVGKDSEYKNTGSVVPVANAGPGGPGGPTGPGPTGPGASGPGATGPVKLDVPELSDIESVQVIKYNDPVTKVEKAKVIFKIRNSSNDRSKVAGVDARIKPSA